MWSLPIHHSESPAALPETAPTPRFGSLALAAVAHACAQGLGEEEAEAVRAVAGPAARDARDLRAVFYRSLHSPAPGDEPLAHLAGAMNLASAEILAVALAATVEDDALAGRLLAHVQSPLGGSRPTLGLMARAFPLAVAGGTPVLPTLLEGHALASGLLVLQNDAAPLPERAVTVPTPLWLALGGRDGAWPGCTVGPGGTGPVPLPESVREQARRHAGALRGSGQRALVVRSGSPAEARAVAVEVAGALDRRPLFIETEKLTGIGPWLVLRSLLPVFCLQLAPSEARGLPELPGYRGPVLAICGPDGGIETTHGSAATWRLPVASAQERADLWQTALGEPDLAARLAREHRHGAGRIAHLGRLARHQADIAGRETPDETDLLAAAWTGEGGGLDALAEPLRTRVPDDALVTTPALLEELEAVLLRCRLRDQLADGLGVSASANYRPGVRALFTGPSGTGKTLAAGWIATRLGLPLHRVDLAAITSRYIGETEKNLSQLLARAEQAEVVLFFDEADSLFGKRTDISDSNDRFANAQTNYLLQRIENYDGIVVLTSNSQARFDSAFARRIDFVVEFSHPAPEQRRAIWVSHLGAESGLTPAELNQLAALADFTGGHIRNTVLAAAANARRAERPIGFPDLAAAAGAELRKLGRQTPAGLRESGGSA